MHTRMVRLRLVVLLTMLTTCLADRLDVLESQMKRMKYFESYVETTLNTIAGDVGSLTERVSKLELNVATSGTDNDSNGSRAGSSGEETYTKLEIKDIRNKLEMYHHAFARQKKDFVDVKVFVNNTTVEGARQLRSDVLIYLGNISAEVKTDMDMHFKREKQEHNKTLLALNTQVLDHLANETDTLKTFKTNILQDVNSLRVLAQNETIELEKNVEKLIGRANEVVGIIDNQRSTIEDGIMVTIKVLHIYWSDWSVWSECSQSCDRGSRSRHRSCDVPPPFTDGICIGNDTDTEECAIQDCPVDCYDLQKQNQGLPSGVYNLSLWRSHLTIPVYCDMTTASGGWTVIQHRYDGSVDFYRTLSEYTHGFGDVSTEFWLGLSYIKEIADNGNTTIRMEISAADGSSAYEEWPEFRLGDASTYTLHVGGRGIGTAADTRRRFDGFNNGSDFTAKGSFCGDSLHGGWWYNSCTYINLNGEYVTPGTLSGYHDGWGGMIYYSFKQLVSLKTSTIMIRRND
ncbi:angiopoietin-1-like [Mya arenaria]|nr:angiopoietin-1-like [Mya arenaria]